MDGWMDGHSRIRVVKLTYSINSLVMSVTSICIWSLYMHMYSRVVVGGDIVEFGVVAFGF